MQMRNSPERIDRIKEFVVAAKFFSNNGRAELGLHFSEAVIVNPLTLQGINVKIETLIHDHGEAAPHHIQSFITELMRNALLTCNAVFADETDEEQEFFADDEQAIRMSEGGFETIDPDWS